MPDTEKREEGKGLPKGSSGMPASGPANDEVQEAQSSSSLGAEEQPAEAGGEASHSAEDVTGGQSIGDFADSVVSGLEQASLGGENENTDLHALDLEHMSEAFFAGWGSADEDAGDARSDGRQADMQTLSEVTLSSLAPDNRDQPVFSGRDAGAPGEMSRMSMSSWSASEGAASSSGRGQTEGRGFGMASDVSLASWGASEGMGSDSAAYEGEPEEDPQQQMGVQTLAGLGLQTGAAFSDYAPAPGGDPGKHDELADAVDSALRSVYGDQPAKPAAKSFPRQAAAEEKSAPSLVWDRNSDSPGDDLTPQEVIYNYFDYNPGDEDSRPAREPEPQGDGLTPQEVILNYFDYQGAQNGNGYPSAGRPAARDYEEPIALRPVSEPAVSLRRAPQPEERPVHRDEWRPAHREEWGPPQRDEWRPAHRDEWTQQAPQPQQYSGPPSFPVPGPVLPPAPSAAHVSAQESSRLLGAAAIGLMGGIAIAASLAAFLIYGPHPAAVKIPGIGDLRLDRDEQGYGRTLQDEAAGGGAGAPAAMQSQILASDTVAAPGQPAPLAITVNSQQPFEKMLVSISGVPEGARLSAGVDTGNGSWLIAPRRLNGLTINLPAGSPSTVALEAQLLDSNARTPLSTQAKFSVRVTQLGGTVSPAYPGTGSRAAPAGQPQAAGSYPFTTQILSNPPAAASVQPPVPKPSHRTQFPAPAPQPRRHAAVAPQPAAAPAPKPFTSRPVRRATPRPEAESLIREGNKHMREGDIVGARQLYQKALAFGDAEAALAMGRSFDPIYFARIQNRNADPDAAKAFDWYKQAMDAGASQTAMVRIENLKHFLNE